MQITAFLNYSRLLPFFKSKINTVVFVESYNKTWYNNGTENQRAGRLTLYLHGGANPPDERKEGLPMVTYSEMIQFCIFIVALVSLCYQIFKDKRK